MAVFIDKKGIRTLTFDQTMMNIPVDIWREILLRLPAVYLFRLRAVCKGWCSVMDDPCFIKAHTNYQLNGRPTFIIRNSTGPPFSPLYYIDDDLEDLNFTNGLQTIPATPLKMTRRGLKRLEALPVATCNGLMLISNWYLEGVCEIWNLLTQERLEVPRLHIDSDDIEGIGLGYDCAADDYKVVVIQGDDFDNQTHIYSLRSDSWRVIGNCPFDESFRNGQGVFLSGALHWVSEERIIVFDVGNESYRQLVLPSFGIRKALESLELGVSSGCLFLSKNSITWFDLWVMNDYGGWIKLLECDDGTISRPIAYMKNKNQLLLQGFRKFVWFDVESKTLKSIDIHGFSRDCTAQICVGTLFRLHDSCGRRRVAPASSKRRRTRDVKTAAHTKLTFCVSDYDSNHKFIGWSRDNCHSPCPNWYHSSGLERIKVCETSFDPHSDSASTLSPDWKAVIDDPCFVKVHTNKQLMSNNNNTILIHNTTGPPFYPLYSFNLDELDFTEALQKITVTPHEFTGSRFPCLPVAEYNGLMLIGDDEKFQLWNPLTGEHLELPQVLEFINSNPKRDQAIGLGYEQATDDYKVVVIHWEQKEKVYRIHVYSLRSDSWNVITGDCLFGDKKWVTDSLGVYMSGALHWLSTRGGKSKITVLDLVTESYRQIQGPDLGRGGNWGDRNSCLGVLGGCLIVNDYCTYDNLRLYYDVWVMKDYGSEDSWFKLISIHEFSGEHKFCGTRGDELRTLTYVKNKTQILVQDGKGFYLHDVGSDSMKTFISIHGLAKDLSSQIFAGSKFRLHDNCGVSGKRRIRKRKSNMKRPADTEFYFCVRNVDYGFVSHDSCYTVDSNWYCACSENED